MIFCILGITLVVGSASKPDPPTTNSSNIDPVELYPYNLNWYNTSLATDGLLQNKFIFQIPGGIKLGLFNSTLDIANWVDQSS